MIRYTLTCPDHPSASLEAFNAFAAARAYTAAHDLPDGAELVVCCGCDEVARWIVQRTITLRRVLSAQEREADRVRAEGLVQTDLFGGIP